MKVVILAGGRGSRISEESKYKPKPMVKIGNKPIIWHIIKYYETFGFSEFIICAGYKKKILKNFFSKNNGIKGKVTVVNTGLNSMTGGRIKKIKKHVIKDKNFLLTYGDGLSNINLIKLINLHMKMNKIVTLSAVKPNSKYGIVKLNKNKVKNFEEKPNSHFISGGFFVISTKIFEYIKNEKNIFEFHCLPVLAKRNQLAAYKHNGFWHCLDTMRDKEDLNKLWKKKPLWKIW
jgi:glucose-1-phosphate cytidylyltransferase